MDAHRSQRMAEVASRRLGHVRCAIEHVHHRHNTSAILRSCEALGVQHVHLIGEATFRPSVGPAKGAGHWLTLHRHTTVADALDALTVAGVDLWVADLADPPTPPEAVPVDRPVCLWFGAEVIGVHADARAAAAGVVTIPMQGFAQSLNVSVAAALCLSAVCARSRKSLGAAALLDPDARAELLAGWIERDHAEMDQTRARAEALALLGGTPAG